jgi:hypothetical protein
MYKYNPIIVAHFLENFSLFKDVGLKKQIMSIYSIMGSNGDYTKSLDGFLEKIKGYWTSRKLYLTNRAYEKMEMPEAQIEQYMNAEGGPNYDAIARDYGIDDLNNYPEEIFDGQGKGTK